METKKYKVTINYTKKDHASLITATVAPILESIKKQLEPSGMKVDWQELIIHGK